MLGNVCLLCWVGTYLVGATRVREMGRYHSIVSLDVLSRSLLLWLVMTGCSCLTENNGMES